MKFVKTTIKKASYGKTVITLSHVPNCKLGHYMLEVAHIGMGSSMCILDDEYRADAIFKNTASYHRITRGKCMFSGIKQHRLECEVGELLEKESNDNAVAHVMMVERKLKTGELVEFENPYYDKHWIIDTPEERQKIHDQWHEENEAEYNNALHDGC